jgi:hypothetical protein
MASSHRVQPKGTYFSVEVENLGELEQVPGDLERAQRRFVEDLADDLTNAIRKTIRSRSGRLAASWRGRALTDSLALVETSKARAPHATASLRGNYVTAKTAKVLRFPAGGRLVFARAVRYYSGSYVGKPGDRKSTYVAKAFRKRAQIAREAFARRFGKLQGV